MLNVTDPWAAYCIDNAVSMFGNAVQNALAKRDKNGNELYALSDILRTVDKTAPPMPIDAAISMLQGQAMRLVQVIEKP